MDEENIEWFFKKNNIKIKSIAGGAFHYLFLSLSVDLYSFGSNGHGECGKGERSGRYDVVDIPYKIKFDDKFKIIKILCGSACSFALSSTNELFMWGQIYLNKKFRSYFLSPHKFDKVSQLGKEYIIDDIYAVNKNVILLLSHVDL